MFSNLQQSNPPTPRAQPPIARVIGRMAWVATTDLVHQLLILGLELLSGRRRAARSDLRSTLGSMNERQLRDLGLSSPPARICNRQFSETQAQLGMVR
jgi:uncharacterized protein YjiS (DUF1127 family)